MGMADAVGQVWVLLTAEVVVAWDKELRLMRKRPQPLDTLAKGLNGAARG